MGREVGGGFKIGNIPGTKELARQVPIASSKNGEIMAPSKTCFLSGAQRCDGCAWERWAASGQKLIDVPILEIKKKKDMKVTAPEVICSFTYLFVDSFISHLLQEARH